MEVTYDYYRIFYYAAKYKSFSQAATILMSNQPNVTRAIHNLESQLGCRLFIRSNRGAELTPEGERLYSHVAIVLVMQEWYQGKTHTTDCIRSSACSRARA